LNRRAGGSHYFYLPLFPEAHTFCLQGGILS
jgi:hypothetical protein